MEECTEDDQIHPLPRTIATLAVLFAFVMSVITLMNYSFYVNLRSGVSNIFISLGIGFNIDLILIGMMFLVVLVGVIREKWLKTTLRSGWVMLIPAILFFSKIDWMYLAGMPGNFSLFSNALPEVYIFLNGVALICASLLFRSHIHLIWLRSKLARRGASSEDLNPAMRANFFFLLILVAMSAGAAALIAGAVGIITPAFSIASGAAADAYLIVGLIANAAIIAVFSIYIWKSRRTTTIGP
jgi:hypothetical protein